MSFAIRFRTMLRILLPGLGGCLAIWAALALGDAAQMPLIMAPFGATCVIAFALPESPLAQPRNVIGGHLISSAIGFAALYGFGVHAWSMALAVGAAIIAMQLSRTVHPPAGADPLLILLTQPQPYFLLTPVLLGSVLIVLVAWAYHRTCGVPYPKRRG